MKEPKDTYRTLAGESTGEFRDRGSKFLAYAHPVFTEAEWQERLEEVRKLHPKARHHCYAYRLGLDGNNFRANDDGEPSGTAGRPILGQIDSFGLTNVIVIVVRYFGGTLLGTSGLIQAYRESTADALQKARILEKTVEDIYRLHFDYAVMGEVMNAVKSLDLEMVSQDFGDSASIDIAVRQSQVADVLLRIRAKVGNLHLEEAARIDEIEGLQVVFLHSR